MAGNKRGSGAELWPVDTAMRALHAGRAGLCLITRAGRGGRQWILGLRFGPYVNATWMSLPEG
ncbi:hypothetical protein GCM10018783_34570 [Streptomyces griseosporeus]|nr:hypothetical protein GCM10018783_34570 [Streptomyces griseosporeus]